MQIDFVIVVFATYYFTVLMHRPRFVSNGLDRNKKNEEMFVANPPSRHFFFVCSVSKYASFVPCCLAVRKLRVKPEC